MSQNTHETTITCIISSRQHHRHQHGHHHWAHLGGVRGFTTADASVGAGYNLRDLKASQVEPMSKYS